MLIVDDAYGLRESIAYTLSTEFQVVTADCSEGIKRVQERHFSVVLLDIRMPEMDGIRALEAIRKIERDVSTDAPQDRSDDRCRSREANPAREGRDLLP